MSFRSRTLEGAFSLALVLMLVGCRRPAPPGELVAGRAIERTFGADHRPHRFRVKTAPGQFVAIVADQRGVDVALDLHAGNPARDVVADTPNADRGPEWLLLLATGREVIFDVRWNNGLARGRYRLELIARRKATRKDRLRVVAFQALSSGARKMAGNDLPSREAALAEYVRAASLAERSGDQRLQAIAEIRIAKTLRRLERFAEAVTAFEQARNSVQVARAPDLEPSLEANLGILLRQLGETAKSEAAFERCLRVSLRMGNVRETAVAFDSLANADRQAGRLWSSLSRQAKARSIFRALDDRRSEAKAWLQSAVPLTQLGRLEEARDAYDRAESIPGGLDESDRAGLLWGRGRVELEAGQLDVARGLLSQARAKSSERGDRRGEAYALERLAELDLRAGRPAQARAGFAQAAEIFRRLETPTDEANTRVGQARAELALGHAAIARDHASLAIETLRETKDPVGVADALVVRARTFDAMGDPAAALVDAARAVQLVDVLRGSLESPALRSEFLATVFDPYELAIDLLIRRDESEPHQGYVERALDLVERGRARSLLDLLAEARRSAGREPSVVRTRLGEVERQLGARDAERRRRLESGDTVDTASGKVLDAAIRDLLTEQDVLEGALRSEADEAPEIPPPLGTREIQRSVLDPETTLAVYSLGARESFVWLVTSERITVHRLGPRAPIEDAAVRLNRLLAASHLKGSAGQARLVASDLGRRLLGPIVNDLQTPRFAVVADGALHYVPFGALPIPTAAPKGRDDRSGSLLIEHYEVVMLPSASVLAASRRIARARPRPPSLLALVADPAFSPPPRKIASNGPLGLFQIAAFLGLAPDRQAPGGPSGGTGSRGEFESLRFARPEAEAILRLAPKTGVASFQGFAARREVVLDGRLARFRMVHIATHGVLNAEHPELSGLALATVDARGKPHEGLLRAYEIAHLRLPADLVTLSACRTALGREVRGEGMIGLPQSIQAAGATRVVTSLWDVDDEATAVLMERFYTGMLRDGQAPAAALRTAQLSMLHESRWRAAAYWAPFIFQGDWRPMAR